jgi:hypothetical protein
MIEEFWSFGGPQILVIGCAWKVDARKSPGPGKNACNSSKFRLRRKQNATPVHTAGLTGFLDGKKVATVTA